VRVTQCIELVEISLKYLDTIGLDSKSWFRGRTTRRAKTPSHE